jgi:hypothetical protein
MYTMDIKNPVVLVNYRVSIGGEGGIRTHVRLRAN